MRLVLRRDGGVDAGSGASLLCMQRVPSGLVLALSCYPEPGGKVIYANLARALWGRIGRCISLECAVSELDEQGMRWFPEAAADGVVGY